MKIALIAALLALCGPDPVPQQPGIVVDAATKTIRVPCRIAPRKLANLPDIYPCEVVATWPAPKGGKAHETVVNFDIMPSEVHKALESLGLKPGHPGRGEDPVAAGPECEVLLEIPGANKAPPRVLPIESVMIDKKTGKTFPPIKWYFTGSILHDGKYGADTGGTLISVYPVTDEVVMQSELTMKEEGTIKIETAKNLLPAEGSPVTLLIRPAAGPRSAVKSSDADPERQVLKFSQGVGPGNAPAPSVSSGSAPSSAGSTADPFEHRNEVRTGKSLPDSSRPIDVPKQ
jgi:hypothetical protein